MSKKGMNRRQFMRTTGGVAAGAAAASMGMVVAPDGSWAMQPKALDEHTVATLVRLCRECYPHDMIGDMYYAKVVEGLDAKAADDAGMKSKLTDGVKQLDAVFGVKWLELSDGNKLKAVLTMDDSDFFQTVRGETVVGLYNNPLVWRFFGYEGPSAEFGGYLNRGFDDISWIKS